MWKQLWTGVVTLMAVTSLTDAALQSRVLAVLLGAFGHHASENHAGKDHSSEYLQGINLTSAPSPGPISRRRFCRMSPLPTVNLAGANFTNAVLWESIFRGAVLTPETTFRGRGSATPTFPTRIYAAVTSAVPVHRQSESLWTNL